MYKIIRTENSIYKYLILPLFHDLDLLNYDDIANELLEFHAIESLIIIDNLIFMGINDRRRFIKAEFINKKINNIAVDDKVDKYIKNLSLEFYRNHENYLRYSVMPRVTIKKYLSGAI